jgi:crotonobetainyl-CoA:carnitine CoA-transferase CaiB-like acyl-CoA transferase
VSETVPPRMAGGAETETILAENGFSEEEIAALREAGATGAD